MLRRVRRLADKIIRDSFPLLQGTRICFIVAPFRFYALSLWIPHIIRLVIISTRVRQMTDFVITGIIAHELCHQERYLTMGTTRYLRFAVGYLFSDKARTEEERATDFLTIEKGYARELHELTLISRADAHHKTIIGNYLTPEEIIGHALKSGKWN
ncbi:MAG TPA: hypothetical protein P5257_06310 [Bacteroidales bacterium]|nr:hypothetical protein [Bacteroidales bacterium]